MRCSMPSLFLGGLGLGGTTEPLGTVLALLALLPGGLLGLGKTVTDETVLGLEALGRVEGVVDQGKARGATTTKSGLEAKAEDGLLVSLVHGGELAADLILGEVSEAGMKDIDDLCVAWQRKEK